MLPHPPPGPPRRRFVALCSLAFAALVVGFAVGAGGGSEPKSTLPEKAKPPERAVAKAKGLSLERQIGEVLMIAFPGTTPPGYVQRALRQGRVAGVILFGGNAPRPEVTRALTRRIQHAARGRALIATDQEGGSIRILDWAAPDKSQGATPTEFEAKRQATQAAKDLAAAGVNVTLAPVADVGGSGSVMHGRAFPGGASDVAALTKAAVSGYDGTRVAPTLKHFPGLGAAGTNPAARPVTISSPAPAIATRALPPFAAGIKADAPLVMASHALYTGLDRRNIASQSKPILTTLLRQKLGFTGVVVTDSMEADAVLKRSSIQIAALRSLSAGADLLLLTGPGSWPIVS